MAERRWAPPPSGAGGGKTKGQGTAGYHEGRDAQFRRLGTCLMSSPGAADRTAPPGWACPDGASEGSWSIQTVHRLRIEPSVAVLATEARNARAC